MNIITAMDNESINFALKTNINNCKVYPDIIYFEGIIEMLNKNQNIDVLIINSRLGEDEEFMNIIKQIKNINSDIEIFAFIKKEKDFLRKYLISYNITQIYTSEKINIKNLINDLNKNEELKTKELEKEIIELKKALVDFKNKDKVQDSNKEKQIKPKKELKSINNIVKLNNRHKKTSENQKENNKILDNKNKHKLNISNIFNKIKNIKTIKKLVKNQSLAEENLQYNFKEKNNTEIINMKALRTEILNKYGSIKAYKKYKEKTIKANQKKALDLKVEESLMRIIEKIEINIKNDRGKNGKND